MAPKSHVIVPQRRPGQVTCEEAEDVVEAGSGRPPAGPGTQHLTPQTNFWLRPRPLNKLQTPLDASGRTPP